MSSTWTSSNQVVLQDQVPYALRRRWIDQGHCPDSDLFALFRQRVSEHPERQAVIDPLGTVDYATLDTAVGLIASVLMDAGLGRSDIVGIQVPNGRDAVAAELAVAAIGALALPYPPGRGRRDSLSLLGRSRASAVITAETVGDVPLARNLAELRSDLPDLRDVFVFGSSPPGCKALRLCFDQAGDSPRGWTHQPIDAEAPARILVSSGSETEPKMVAYSHNAMAGGRGRYMATLNMDSSPMRNLFLVPLAAAFGSCGTSVTLACHGGTLILMPRFDPGTALRMITSSRPTHVFAVPTMLRRMVNHQCEPGEDMSSLKAVVAGGAALDESIFEACQKRFGCEVVRLYGSADGVNCHTAGGARPDGRCVGRPDPAVTSIRIVDPSGECVDPGQQGEIWALGPMTPLCYVNSAELDTRYRAPGGWVRTGDSGYLDEQGYLHVVDRIKRLVIRGGYNISPAEVEQQLGAHPLIAEAVCVGKPDRDLGERLCACIAQHSGTAPLSLPQINEFLELDRGLERKKLPESVIHLARLPIGPAGKVCFETLKRLAAGEAIEDSIMLS